MLRGKKTSFTTTLNIIIINNNKEKRVSKAVSREEHLRGVVHIPGYMKGKVLVSVLLP